VKTPRKCVDVSTTYDAGQVRTVRVFNRFIFFCFHALDGILDAM